jgi:hypothetical protein
MTKKLFIGMLTLTFVVAFLGLFKLGLPEVEASGSQQGSTSVSLSVTSYFDEFNVVAATNLPVATYGAQFAFDGNLATDVDYEFAFWVVNGVVRQDLPVDYTFTLTYENELQAVFRPTTHYSVAFMDTNGKILKVEYVDKSGTADATAPSYPSKPGLTATGWTQAFTDVTTNVITTVSYTASNTSEYAITVNNGTGDGNYVYNNLATVTADAAPSGQVFHHWEVDDLTVSYQSTYTFTVLEALTLTAYYAESAAADLPRIMLSNNTGIRTAESKKTYVGQYYLPAGYTFVEAGVLTHATNTAMIDIQTSGVVRNQATRFTSDTKEFLMSFDNASAACARGYLIAKNGSNELVTVYSENAYNVLNGGFETDSLYGWNAYQIWKNESGMMAFQDARVVNDTYFGSNPYNRDGSYNLGIVWDGAAWDQSSERMGHLRSSDFVLGGSGWVSFKLGGGKTTSIAYVSVRRTEDNVEVARFGNKNYNNTTIASTQYGSSISNAEAFLFQYYFDLSTVTSLGTSLYFVITEASSFDWAIMSADSFVSYLPTAPSTNSDTLATNIVPTILNTGTADNTIKNGYFNTDMSDWSVVNSNWYYSSNHYAKSNSGGDSGLGVIRSSAFIVTTNKYIRFDWAGGLRYDKQIYISVKEVGTNIEVLRFVRRDNLSSKESESFDNHMLNLSGLDSTKQYYLEYADNRSGGWGISYVDAVRLVPESEWNSVTSGDRAVSISGIVTNYVYVKPTALN